MQLNVCPCHSMMNQDMESCAQLTTIQDSIYQTHTRTGTRNPPHAGSFIILIYQFSSVNFAYRGNVYPRMLRFALRKISHFPVFIQNNLLNTFPRL